MIMMVSQGWWMALDSRQYDDNDDDVDDNDDDDDDDGDDDDEEDDDVDSSGCVCDQLQLESLSGPAP